MKSDLDDWRQAKRGRAGRFVKGTKPGPGRPKKTANHLIVNDQTSGPTRIEPAPTAEEIQAISGKLTLSSRVLEKKSSKTIIRQTLQLLKHPEFTQELLTIRLEQNMETSTWQPPRSPG